MALSGFGQSLALERTEPEVIRAARFALRLRNPAHRDVLRQLKDRLDGFRFQQRPFSRQTRALHADLSRYLAA